MRIARVIHESSPFPVIALERDGALYDVGELDRRFETEHCPDRLVGATDFFTRVISLRCNGLAALDQRVRSGDRPTEARLLPGAFLWLPPCDGDRSFYIHVEPARGDTEPSYRLGNARGLLGHETRVAFPARETRPDFELAIAAILAEDLRRASADEADRAILGFTILNAWTARDEEARHRDAARARDFAPQIGPFLVTREDLDDIAKLRTQARIDGQVVASGTVGVAATGLAEAIAFVSHRIDLRAGDLIGATCLRGNGVAYGATVEVLIERLGKLAGCPARGAESAGWRRSG